MLVRLLPVLVGFGSVYAFYRVGALAGCSLLLIAVFLFWKGGRRMHPGAKQGVWISTVLFAALSVSGCASTPGGITPITRLKEGANLASFSHLSVEVRHADGVPMMPIERERILNLLIAKIRQEGPGRFTDITSSASDRSTLHVDVNVTRYEKGSAFARFMLAGLGQIHIDATVVLEDREKRERLGEYEVTKTFAWGGFYGGATRIEDVEEGFVSVIAGLVLGKEGQ